MNKNEKLVLKCFIETLVPADFEADMENVMFIEYLIGIAHTLRRFKIPSEQVENLNFMFEERKSRLIFISNKNYENKFYYNLIVLVVIIINKNNSRF